MPFLFITNNRQIHLNFKSKIVPPSVHYVSPGLKSDAFLVHHCSNHRQIQTRHRLCVVDSRYRGGFAPRLSKLHFLKKEKNSELGIQAFVLKVIYKIE